MKLIKIFTAVFLLFLSINTYAQTASAEQPAANDANAESASSKNPFDEPFWQNTDFFCGVGPAVYISTGAQTDSAVSPVIYPVYFGFLWPKDYYFSIQPSLRFFTGYFYMKDGHVYPAEIENRTALAYSFFFNIPVSLKMNILNVSDLSLSAGLGFLFRFAGLAPDVNDSDYGDTGTAGGDLGEINKWFWGGGRFIYLTLGADWLFQITEDIQVGPEFSLFIPLGPLFTKFSLNGMIISLGIKFVF